MPYDGRMLDRVLGALTVYAGRWLASREIAAVLGLEKHERVALDSAIRRGCRHRLIEHRGRRWSRSYRLAPDIDQQLERVVAAQRKAQRGNMLRAQAIYVERHREARP